MEAIGRLHQITKAFLQQTCLDIERNGLSSIIGLFNLTKYRNAFGGVHSNIPMFARSAIGRHTEVSPVLPGKLPLSKPVGKMRPSNLFISKTEPGPSVDDDAAHGSLECFQAMLGPITRNIGGTGAIRLTDQTNKRKRMSPSPNPSTRPLSGERDRTPSDVDFTRSHGRDSTSQAHLSAAGGMFENGQYSSINLPDRTQTSTAFPSISVYNGFADSQSGYTSNQSPVSFGLGSSLEENTFDLRPFQGRVATPLWQNTDDTLFQQIAQSMMDDTRVSGGTNLWEQPFRDNTGWNNEP